MILALPHIILLAGDLLALLMTLSAAFAASNYGSIIIIYWLAVNAMHLIMAVIFMLGRKNYRVNDRFLVQIPVEIEYEGQKFKGVTADASETGLAIVMDDSIYMPHGEDRMKIHLKTERYESSFTAHCVHVRKQKGKWKYGVEIREMDETDKAEYFQILYDRDHSLAKTMSASAGIFDDIFLNVKKRASLTQSSRRELPRIEINRELLTSQGEAVHVINCNYEYLLADGEGLPEIMELKIPGSSQVLKCRYSGLKQGLYQVENWRELLAEDAFSDLFAAGQAEG